MQRVIGIDEVHAFDYEILKEIKRICENNHIPYFLAFGTALGAMRHEGFIPWDVDADVIMPISFFQKFEEACKKELNERYVLHTAAESTHPEYFMRIGLKYHPETEVYVDIFMLIGAPEDDEERINLYSKVMKLRRWRDLMFLDPQKGKNFIKKLLRLFARTGSRLIPVRVWNKMFFEVCNKTPYSIAKYVYCPCGAYDAKKPRWFDKCMYEPGRIVKFEDDGFIVPNRVEEYLNEYYKDYKKYPPEYVRNNGLNFKTIINE